MAPPRRSRRCAGLHDLHVNRVSLPAPQGEGGVADPDDERIAPGSGLGEHLEFLARNKAELEQTSLQHCQRAGSTHAQHPSPDSGRECAEAEWLHVNSVRKGARQSVHAIEYMRTVRICNAVSSQPEEGCMDSLPRNPPDPDKIAPIVPKRTIETF